MFYLSRGNANHLMLIDIIHLGRIPLKKGFNSTGMKADKRSVLLNPNHDWTTSLHQGPQDIGFDTSLMTLTGIQAPPYAFFRNGFLENNHSNITFWNKGEYPMLSGTSIVDYSGEGSIDWDSSGYNMVLVNETEKFLNAYLTNMSKKNETDYQPFFGYVALGNVHVPHSPPSYYLDGSIVSGYYPSGHLDVLREMDLTVGALIKILEDKNLIDNTIVIFTSDNGGLASNGNTRVTSAKYGHNSSGHLRGSKGQIYEGGHRVPLVMRWDGGIPKAERRSHFVGLNDIFATLCKLVGIDVPIGQAIDSVSFADYLINENKRDNLRKSLGIWRMFKHEFQAESIRMGRYKLIRDRANGNLQLYNLRDDISETNNLILDQKYESIVKIMLERLIEIGPCYENKAPFEVENMIDGNTNIVNCTWFRLKKKNCQVYPEASIQCKLTCLQQNADLCSH